MHIRRVPKKQLIDLQKIVIRSHRNQRQIVAETAEELNISWLRADATKED